MLNCSHAAFLTLRREPGEPPLPAGMQDGNVGEAVIVPSDLQVIALYEPPDSTAEARGPRGQWLRVQLPANPSQIVHAGRKAKAHALGEPIATLGGPVQRSNGARPLRQGPG